MCKLLPAGNLKNQGFRHSKLFLGELFECEKKEKKQVNKRKTKHKHVSLGSILKKGSSIKKWPSVNFE